MNIAVRRASEADAEVVSLLNADVQSLHASAVPTRFKPLGPDTFPATAARRLLVNPSNLVFIAELDSEPAGYAYAEVVHLPESPLRHAWDEVHLHHISIRPAYRRKGVASALLDYVRAAADEIGISLVTLQVWSFNEGAQAFFRRQGFTPYMVRLWNRSEPT
jgi:ribosomal protein S18 acetylase RimI-like enzyme